MPDEPEAPREEQGGDSGRLGGILGKAGAVTERFALGPARAVARQGKDALTEEAERAIDGVLAGPLPEAVGRSIVQHHVVERVVTEAIETKTAELREGGDEQLEQTAGGVFDNPALERAIANIVDSRMTKEL